MLQAEHAGADHRPPGEVAEHDEHRHEQDERAQRCAAPATRTAAARRDVGARPPAGPRSLPRRQLPCDERRHLGLGLGEEGRDVGALVGQHGLHDGVEDGVHLLRLGRRLGHDRLLEDVVLEHRHLVERDVDVVGDPGVGLGELLGVEDRQRRRPDRGVRGGQRLGVGDGLRLVGQLLHVEEVDPLHAGLLLGVGRVGPDGGDGTAAEHAGVGAVEREDRQAVGGRDRPRSR